MDKKSKASLYSYISELREMLRCLSKSKDYLNEKGKYLLEALQHMEDLLCHADSVEAWLEMANGTLNSDQKIEAAGWLLRLKHIAANEQQGIKEPHGGKGEQT